MSKLITNLYQRKNQLMFFASLMISVSLNAQEVKWSFDGDSAKHDLANKTIRYFGNTRFENEQYVITGEMLEVKQTGSQNLRNIRVEGKPAKVVSHLKQQNNFTLSATQINYTESQSLLESQGQVNIKLKSAQGEVLLSGNDLKITQAAQGIISISGAPASMEMLQSDGKSMSANATDIVFDQSANLFTMQGKVTLRTERETITAAKIFYNIANKTLEIPKVPNERVEMVQKVKSQ